GLGRMGFALAERLIRRGIPVALWNRSAGRADALVAKGATLQESPAMLARACRVVLTSLKDDDALDKVYLGPDGLLRGDQTGLLLIDTSTVLPDTVIRIGQEAARRGSAFIDAPLLGTVAPARQGRLIVVAGGDARDVQKAKTTLEHFARVVHHV